MGVPKGTKNPCNCVQVQAKPRAKSEDYWPQVSYFILAHGWRLVWVQGVLPLQMVMNLFQCPRGGREGTKSQQLIIISTKTMASFQSIPSLSTVNSIHITPIFLHQEKVYFPQNLKSPRIQHRTGCAGRGDHCLRNILLPSPRAIRTIVNVLRR